MNGLDPAPHLKTAKIPSDSPVICPTCKTNFIAARGFIFLTYWHITDELGGRERKAGYLCFDKLACILCFVNDEESGHC
jgi:hypothetical protein